ncbi:TolC family outer membrane protein [Variovorax sp. PCZ-1]|uniref:TolC family outer membrane protein n=1 Tax=Variovorax sp. PCZ-1 TaxID=2835533 RepID=UPI001BCAFBF2|nr:TolC family outer membrane protein [Variovorax sp. PCZ-1]MBS7807546.1 TolC family outer membrane protein [Variovorax sp. PCZ-1]
MFEFPRLPRSAIFLAASALASATYAQSLSELYQAASTYDATYQSAKSQYEANLARAEQAKAGLLPTIGATASVSGTNADVIKPAANANRTFGSQSAAINASQPLYRPANRATAAQGELQATQAKSALITAEQDLIVRVTQAYFDVLASQDSLTFVKAQKTAVAEQLAAAKRNFEVGTSTITDTREAQARFDLVVAQEIAAENDLRVKRIALDQLVGKSGVAPKPLALPAKLPDVLPADVNLWVNQAQEQHPSIKAAELAVDIAKLETTKAQAGEKPTVDLTGSYGLSYSSGSASSRINSESRNATIGIALNYPLFSGYATQNRIKETLQLEDKARNDLEAAKRSISQATRTAYFGVLSGQGQVKALEAAEASSQSALDANKLGYQVGVRINIDVLNSQSQLFQTKRDLAKARYDVLVGGLRLRQANGTLKAEDLGAVNALLAR